MQRSPTFAHRNEAFAYRTQRSPTERNVRSQNAAFADRTKRSPTEHSVAFAHRTERSLTACSVCTPNEAFAHRTMVAKNSENCTPNSRTFNKNVHPWNNPLAIRYTYPHQPSRTLRQWSLHIGPPESGGTAVSSDSIAVQ